MINNILTGLGGDEHELHRADRSRKRRSFRSRDDELLNLLSRPSVQIHVNLPDTSTPPSNSVIFVTTGVSHMAVSAPSAEQIVWHSYRGPFVANEITYSVGNGRVTNWVQVTPASALLSFGEENTGKTVPGNCWIETVSNLAAFPNLETLELWGVNLLNLDLTGCHSLLTVKVAGNYQSQTNTDRWLEQVADSVGRSGGSFYYNSTNLDCWAHNHGVTNPVTVGSDAYNKLTSTNWNWTISAWCN